MQRTLESASNTATKALLCLPYQCAPHVVFSLRGTATTLAHDRTIVLTWLLRVGAEQSGPVRRHPASSTAPALLSSTLPTRACLPAPARSFCVSDLMRNSTKLAAKFRHLRRPQGLVRCQVRSELAPALDRPNIPLPTLAAPVCAATQPRHAGCPEPAGDAARARADSA